MDLAPLLPKFVVFPTWIAAGFIDWHLHKRTRIEVTSGWRESLFHWLMFAQMAGACLAVAVLERTAGLLALTAALILLHEATVWVELRYVDPVRVISPTEQLVHSFLEMLPLCGWLLLAVMVENLSDWHLRVREEIVIGREWFFIAAAVGICNALPLGEETWRCICAMHSQAARPVSEP